jgi:hypothetical protein
MVTRSHNHFCRGMSIIIIIIIAIPPLKWFCERVTIVTFIMIMIMIIIIFWVCVCSISYRLCTAHLWPVCLYHTSPHYLKNGTSFGKSYWIENVFWFFVYKFAETFLFLRIIERGDINVHWSSCKIPVVIIIIFNKT